MMVLDSSVVVAALTEAGPSRRLLAGGQAVHVPHLIDAEVTSSLRGQVLGGKLSADAGLELLERLGRVSMVRHPLTGLLGRMWELRDNLTAYDAAYVALAESVDCPLVTGDAGLSRAPGLRCAVTVLPG